MADKGLRDLERRAQAGDERAKVQLLVAQGRSGALPLIPRCPNCDRAVYADKNDLKSHAAEPCLLCSGAGDLPGFDRIVLAAYAGDELARLALGNEEYTRKATPVGLTISIPGCDTYEWEAWLQGCQTHFGPVAAIASLIGAARINLQEEHHPTHPWIDEWKKHVNDALEVFEEWVKEPISSNLVKLAGRSDYGQFQRLFEGCDALASRHRRGGAIFWEGARAFASRTTVADLMGDRLRRAAIAWAREGAW